ncbi:MAG TPA: methyltransferase, partial [Arenibaculum sp.]|nr:methyltransferase [Arenibaculum sp.]
DLARDLAPLRDVLNGGQLSLLCRLWQRNLFAGPLTPPASLRGSLDAAEQVVFDLLVEPVEVDEQSALAVLGGPCIDVLTGRGILARSGGKLLSRGYRFLFASGFNLLTGFDPESPSGEEVRVHFGLDSVMMADLLLHVPEQARGLDLCTGSGALALALAQRCRSSVGVEWVPPVAEIARINVALAGHESRVDIRTGDLFGPVAGERFDIITANPPFSPSLEDPASDPVAIGGNDGLDLARRILDEMGTYLTPKGRMLMLLGLLGDERKSHFTDELERFATKEGWRAEIIEIAEPTPVGRMRIQRLQDEPYERRLAQIRGGAERTGATHYHVELLSLARSDRPGVERLDLSSVARRQTMAREVRQLRRIRAG